MSLCQINEKLIQRKKKEDNKRARTHAGGITKQQVHLIFRIFLSAIHTQKISFVTPTNAHTKANMAATHTHISVVG